MNVSDFLTNEVSPLLLGVFYSRYIFSADKTKIYTEVSYKISKFADDHSYLISSKDSLLKKLNRICAPNNYWEDHTKLTNGHKQAILRFILTNDLNLTEESFFNRLHVKILCQDFVYVDALTEDKKMFIRGFAESRGSIDTTRPLLAMDYFYNSIHELKRARMLYDHFNVPFSVLNFNPRELQHDYVTGTRKRNTQLRFKLYWYAKNIGLLNEYKCAIIKAAYPETIEHFSFQDGVEYFSCPELLPSKKDSFDSMLRYYSNNIFGQELSNSDIKALRKELNFDSATDEKSFKRDLGLIEIIRMNTPDECACCKTTTTYTNKNTGKQSFEYHHVISLGKNHELDDENNIVKLCPTCHRALKRGAAPKQDQIAAIKKILDNRPNVKDFAQHIFDTSDDTVLIEKIWEHLK